SFLRFARQFPYVLRRRAGPARQAPIQLQTCCRVPWRRFRSAKRQWAFVFSFFGHERSVICQPQCYVLSERRKFAPQVRLLAFAISPGETRIATSAVSRSQETRPQAS